jgi:ABC-type anion transport system duplicated permease subunit
MSQAWFFITMASVFDLAAILMKNHSVGIRGSVVGATGKSMPAYRQLKLMMIGLSNANCCNFCIRIDTPWYQN